MSAEEDNVTHFVKGGISEVHQQVLFLFDPDVYSGGKKVRDRIGEHPLAEVNVANTKHGWKHQVERLCEG